MQLLPNTNKFGGRRIYNGLWPSDLPKAFPVLVDLTNITAMPWIIDLQEEQDLGVFPFVQSVYIDNSKNSVGLVLTTSVGQQIVCPAYGQGFFPILDTDHRFSVATLSGGAGQNNQTPIFFLSVPMPLSEWASLASSQIPAGSSSTVLGSYSASLGSGTMTAGLGGNSPIFSFRYGGTGLAIVRRIVITAGDLVGFTPGVLVFILSAARAFTVSDSGGGAATLTGNNAKLRTSFPSTGVADFRASVTTSLVPGTRTLDATPLDIEVFSVTANAGQDVTPVQLTMLSQNAGEQPLQLATNEGFIIAATVPATGTWSFGVKVYWDEVVSF
jgi:hypothetical protein